MDFKEAIELAKAGKSEGYDFLYEKTYSSKYYLALKYMKNEEAAKDVMQDAYMKAFSKLDMLDEPEAFSGWFGTIVANTAKNALVKQSPMLFSDVAVDAEGEEFAFDIEDEDINHQPELAYTQKETTELVHMLLESLSEEQKMSIFMFYIEGLSIKEIAESMECSENTVKSRLNYGRKNLKIKGEELEKKGYKLYGIAPLPLLVYLMSNEQQVLAETGQLSAMAAGASAVEMAGSASAVTGSVTSAVTSEVVKTGVMHTLAGKIAVAGVSVCIVAGGVVASVSFNGNEKETVTTTAENVVEKETGETTEESTTMPDYKYDVGETFTVGDFTYTVTEIGKVTLTSVVEGITGDIVIPEEVEYYRVTELGQGAFRESTITSVVVPGSVEVISGGAFVRCSELTSVTLNEGLKTIKSDAFSSSGITELIIPGTVTLIDRYAVYECIHLEKLVFVDGSEDLIIESEAFSYCSMLKEVVLPENVKSIGVWAFGGCYGLKSINIPESITILEKGVFSYTRISNIYIHAGVEIIANNAFSASKTDTIVVEPENKYYDSRDNCNAIIETDTNILIAGSNNTVIPDGVTAIEYGAFWNCYTLKDIIIPDSVATIGDYAFANCYEIENLYIPDSVTSIGENAFKCQDIDETGVLVGNYNIKILCKEDSYAHTYAVENELIYELVE